MIVQSLVGSCCEPDASTRNTARAIDWVTALALLILGTLSACGLFHLTLPVTYAFIGAGAVYTLVMLLSTSHEIRVSCSHKRF